MAMFSERILGETPELDDEGVRMRFIGRREGVGPLLLEQMRWAEEKTAANDTITLYVAFNYGGRAEIIDAARSFQGSTEEEFRAHLYAPEMHDPDLIIRTSGEQRLSNYLMWQSAYSELHFTRRAVAGLLARRPRGRAGRVRRPQAALRGPLMASRRQPPRRRRSGGSDLGGRILVAIPAIAFAITIIYFGGATFALGALALGPRLIHELFTMLERMRPVRLAGFLGITGMVAAAALGDERDVLLALVAFLPVLFLHPGSPIRERISLSLAATALGVYWIGLGARPRGPAARARPRRRARVHGPARHVRRATPAPTSAAARSAPAGSRRACRRTRRGRAWASACSSASARSGTPAAPTTALDRRHRRPAAGRRGRVRRPARRPVRVADQARRRDEGHRRPVRRPRRRARPPRRRAVLADRRLPGLAGAHERRPTTRRSATAR